GARRKPPRPHARCRRVRRDGTRHRPGRGRSRDHGAAGRCSARGGGGGGKVLRRHDRPQGRQGSFERIGRGGDRAHPRNRCGTRQGLRRLCAVPPRDRGCGGAHGRQTCGAGRARSGGRRELHHRHQHLVAVGHGLRRARKKSGAGRGLSFLQPCAPDAPDRGHRRRADRVACARCAHRRRAANGPPSGARDGHAGI
ncbi:MAG: hypothetical protein AVDCRST_MAG90-1233, partial [uncultured Microvirga sp.]